MNSELDRIMNNIYQGLMVIALILLGVAVVLLLIRASVDPRVRKRIRRKQKERRVIKRTFKKGKAVGIIFGKDWIGRWVYSPIDAEPPHIGVFAPTGGGKTWSILLMTLNALANIIGGYIPDTSGDIWPNILARNKVVYSPESRKTIKYNVFGLIDKEERERNKNRMLEEIALTFFPDREFSNGAERFFYQGGRDILIAALTAFYYIGLDFHEICRKIITSSYEKLFGEIHDTGNEKAIGLLQQFADQKEVDIGGCMGQAASAVQLFGNPDYIDDHNMGRERYGEETFTADVINGHFLILNVPRPLRDIYAPLNILLTKQTMKIMDLREIGQLPYCILALDELSTLLKGSASIEEQLISSMQNIRKYNGRIMYLTQSIKDLDTYIGRDKRSIIVDNTGFIVAMGAFDPETRKFFADLIGKEEVNRTSITTRGTLLPTSSTDTPIEEYRVRPDDFADLPDDELYLIWRGGYLKLKKAFYFNDSDYKDNKNIINEEEGAIPRGSIEDFL